MSKTIDITKLEEQIQEKKDSNKDLELTIDIVRNLTKEDLYSISTNRDLQEEICKKIENYAKEQNEKYFQTVANVAHNLEEYTNIDILEISEYFAFALFWKNLNYELDSNGFEQYFNEYYDEREVLFVLNLLDNFIFLKNASEIIEILDNVNDNFEELDNQQLDKFDKEFRKLNKKFNKQLESFYKKYLIKNGTLFVKQNRYSAE